VRAPALKPAVRQHTCREQRTSREAAYTSRRVYAAGSVLLYALALSQWLCLGRASVRVFVCVCVCVRARGAGTGGG
jgi:hypothetical protein